MMEVEIYMKGFYTVDGVPRYYPVFWGLTTDVEDSFSGGEYTINISCAGSSLLRQLTGFGQCRLVLSNIASATGRV